MVAECPTVQTGPVTKRRKVNAREFPDCVEDLQPCSIVKYIFFRDGAESKISPESDSPEKEDLYWLHKSGGYGMDHMADEIGRPHLSLGDRHPRAINAEEGDVDQFQDAKSEKKNP